MRFPRYPAYKDSGVEWLGEVPEHWEVMPCRAIAHEQTVKNDGAKCEDYLSLMANVGIIPYAEKGDVGNKKPEDLSKCKIVTQGDLVINSMNYGIGSYGLSAYDGVCSPVYIVLKPKNDVIESRFAFRIFENRAFQTFAQSFGNGILEHRCAISWDILKVINVALPPQSEQRIILAFLDRETAKIDALVADYLALIELLQEKRQAVISHAVTKGLDATVPMKDSGVEWLGGVPEHWEVAPLKRFADVIDCKHHTVTFSDEGFPVVSIREIKNDEIVLDEAKRASLEEWEYLREGRVPRHGDLVFCRNASVGAVGYVDSLPEFCLGQDVCLGVDHNSGHPFHAARGISADG